MNSAYYSKKAAKQIAANLEYKTMIEMDARNWVVKSATRWSGWNAAESVYFESPLLFEGDINFEKNFEPLVVSDKDSRSVNLLVSLSKMIKRGAEMCLSDPNWSIMFLSFASAHMPNDHQNLSKYSDEVDGLFEQLVASVNADAEIAKLRSSMSHILRKPGDSVQTPLYRLKTCYEMLLQINYPELALETVKIRADNYCCNCVKFLVSPNTSKIIAEYVTLKQQRGEHLNLMKLCNLVTSHEAGNPTDRLQQAMSLPVSATRLDTSMTAASNVEELLVASSGLSQPGFSKGHRSRSGTPGRNFDSRGRSPFKQRANGTWNTETNNKTFKNEHWEQRKFSSSPGRRNDTFVKGHLNKEKPQNQMRGNTPNRSVFRSPGGRYYRQMSRSPGRARSGSRNQRGRSKSPRQKNCLRCHSASHMADRCPHYPYYQGSGCERCGGLHSTNAHKNHLDRAGSARRLSVQRVAQTHNTELEVAAENGGNGGQGQGQPNMFRTSGFDNIFGQPKNG